MLFRSLNTSLEPIVLTNDNRDGLRQGQFISVITKRNDVVEYLSRTLIMIAVDKDVLPVDQSMENVSTWLTRPCESSDKRPRSSLVTQFEMDAWKGKSQIR